MGFFLGIVLATLVVFWVLYPVVAGQEAPMERDDEELTEAQHRKRVALFALRDVEYDYHAGKLDEEDYLKMKREISSEALEALDAEEAEWAEREGRKAALAAARGAEGSEADEVGGRDSGVEDEIQALRDSLREGVVCRECGQPSPAVAGSVESAGARFEPRVTPSSPGLPPPAPPPDPVPG
jgi:cytochrome c-type biogenesis protein CcmI